MSTNPPPARTAADAAADAGAQVHDVARNQLGRRHAAPLRVAQHPRIDLQLTAQQRQRVARAALLQPRRERIEREQESDHQRLLITAEQKLQRNHRLQHPRHRPPQPGRELTPPRGRLLGDRVRAVALGALARLRTAQPELAVGGRQLRPQGRTHDTRLFWTDPIDMAAARITQHAVPSDLLDHAQT